ncbi:hypothetical protein [Haloplanus pelagicus]|jgi:hypothetical protein|uniref:hypothetical protein n=1 Tax=Haloplanus pelagicus TaxID=2949995 RepID=UPI0020402C29|nr:hypothetical protein [Haloplanus sp. HW8-1]
MERRRLLSGLASLVAGGAAVVGTGAFTSARADRDISVAVADDAGAMLGIEPASGPNGAYTRTQGGELGIDIGKLNTDADTWMDDVFRVTNAGTQPVWLWARLTAGGFKTEYYLYDSADRTPLTLPKSAESLSGRQVEAQYLGVGDSVGVGVYFDTTDQGGTKNNVVALHARADRNDVPNNIGAEAAPGSASSG